MTSQVKTIHVIDGTYELFRNYFGAPKRSAPDGREIGAVAGLLRSLVALLTRQGATHVACAFDHVIESFRNTLYAGYKTGEGVEPELLSQFHLAEDAVAALGVVVWPMIEFEADDALAAAAARFCKSKRVQQILLCSPDKDLAQCVRGKRIVCWDRRRDLVLDESGVEQKFGIKPGTIPDWLALVGDSADGYPGLKGWGERSASAVLARYHHLEKIPADYRQWNVHVSRAQALAETLERNRDEALLYRTLATLREDVPLPEVEPEQLGWRGATERLKALCSDLGINDLPARIPRWRRDA